MTFATFGRPGEILIAEDSPTDVLFAEEAFEEAKVNNNLHVVKDGVKAMAFLTRNSTPIRCAST